MKTIRPLRRISLILILLVLLPALFYTAYEINALGSYEEILSSIYRQQLDVILFSLNQYLWDYMNSRVNKIDLALSELLYSRKDEKLIVFFNNNRSIKSIVLSDSALQKQQVLTSTISGQKNAEFQAEIRETLERSKSVATRLINYSTSGYKKIESIAFNYEKGTEQMDMILLYVSDQLEQQIVGILLDSDVFINTVLAPKLQEVAGDQFSVGVYRSESREAIYTNMDLKFSEANQSKELWIFPGVMLGIKLSGTSIEDLTRQRFYNSLYLIIILDIILIGAAWIAFRNIRREMQLAQMKTDFVSNVSHELRTPLALIRMYAESLELGRVPDEKKKEEYYRIITRESERLTRLINNILNFSRIESGKKQYTFSEIDLNTTITKIIDMYGHHIKTNGFELTLALQQNLALIQADEEAISEALINLLDNAIKYSPKKKHLLIKTSRDDSTVCLEVKDEGIGIDKEQLELIFNKFYRVSDGDIHNTKGSGLGLAIVNHIMQAHGGRIVVNSDPGKGSSFSLLFPIPHKDHT